MPETLTQVRSSIAGLKSELLKLAADEETPEEDLQAMTLKLSAAQQRESALIAAGAAEDPVPAPEPATQDDAFADLVSQASVSEVLRFSAHHTSRVTGATAELQQEMGVDDHVIPMVMLAAATVSATGDSVTKDATLMQVFPSPLSAAMGIERRTVAPGINTVPVVTAPEDGPPETVPIGTAVGDTTVQIDSTMLSPKRLQISATVGRDELATFDGLQSDLAMTLSGALTSAVDRQALYAQGSGILVSGDAPSETTDVADYASIWKSVTDAVDGRYANGLSELMLVLGPDAYRHASNLYRTDQSEMSVIDKLMSATGGVSTTGLIAPPVSDNQEGIVCRRGHTGCVQLYWGGVSTILDPYTGSSEGTLRYSLILMMDTAVVRPQAYVRRSYHLA